MATATILSRRKENDTIYTTVEFTFVNGTVTVEISHFQPVNKAEIVQNIKNRGLTEKKRLDSASLNDSLVTQFTQGESTSF